VLQHDADGKRGGVGFSELEGKSGDMGYGFSDFIRVGTGERTVRFFLVGEREGEKVCKMCDFVVGWGRACKLFAIRSISPLSDRFFLVVLLVFCSIHDIWV
jgi:hypothetical protein